MHILCCFCTDSHENDADVSVSFTDRSRHAALHLAVFSASCRKKIPYWLTHYSSVIVSGFRHTNTFSQVVLDCDDQWWIQTRAWEGFIPISAYSNLPIKNTASWMFFLDSKCIKGVWQSHGPHG